MLPLASNLTGHQSGVFAGGEVSAELLAPPPFTRFTSVSSAASRISEARRTMETVCPAICIPGPMAADYRWRFATLKGVRTDGEGSA